MLPVTDNHGVITEYVPAVIGKRLRDDKRFLLYKDAVEVIEP